MKYFFSRFFFSSWWVLIFILLCGALFEHSQRVKIESIQKLENQLKEIRQERVRLTELNQHLQRQLDSHSDPAWIELTLINELGLVPEGQTKIYFDSH